jgi:hypothetical protein
MTQRTTARDSKLIGARLRVHVPVDPYERPEACEGGRIYSASPSGAFQVRPLDKSGTPHPHGQT